MSDNLFHQLLKALFNLDQDIPSFTPKAKLDTLATPAGESENVTLSRRKFVLGQMCVLGGGGLGTAIALKSCQTASPSFFRELNHMREFVIDRIPSEIVPLKFSPEEIRWFHEHGANRSILEAGLTGSSREFNNFILEHLKFTGGGAISYDGLTELQLKAHRAVSDPSTQLVLLDLISSQTVRNGLSDESQRQLKKIDKSKLKSSADRIIFAEKSLSVGYTSLEPNLALTSSAWQFQDALEIFHDENLATELFNVKNENGQWRIVFVNDFTVSDRLKNDGVKMFYCLGWFMQYHAVNLRGKALKDFSKDHIRVLADYAALPRYHKAAWNMALFASLQFDRMCAAGIDRNITAEIRDRFIEFCLGHGELPTDFKSYVEQRLDPVRFKAADIALVALILHAHCSPAYKRFRNVVGSIEMLMRYIDEINPLSYKVALLTAHQSLGNQLSLEHQVFIDNMKSERGLSIYLPSLDDIKTNIGSN